MQKKYKIVLRGKYCRDMLTHVTPRKYFSIINDDGNPDLVMTYGGDGALLGAEQEFPGIAKLPFRDNRTSPLCPKHNDYARQLDTFLSGKTNKFRLMKIAGYCKGRELLAINDVFIHNANPVSAIRYKVFINGGKYHDEIVGDGVGVSTVHGSTSYYRSITHSIFRVGIGLAFSNSTEVTNHLVLPENSIIDILITRGPAILVADNSNNVVRLVNGDRISISKIKSFATILGLDNFMCPECRKLRHPKD
jgi:NAD+ kinase